MKNEGEDDHKSETQKLDAARATKRMNAARATTTAATD